MNSQPWLDFAIPKDHNDDNFLGDKDPYNPCEKHLNINPGGSCNANNFEVSNLTKCEDGYIFDHSIFSETITTEFELVCDHKSQYQFLGTILMFGILIGSFIGGLVADHYGRRMSMLVALILICPSLIMGGFSPNYEVYAVFRLVNCIGFPIAWLSIHTSLLEMFSNRYKWLVTCIEDLIWPVSMLVLAFLGFLFRDWTTLHIVCGLVCSSACVCWIWMPESLRWLAQNNQQEKAKTNLKAMAKSNGRRLGDEGKRMIETMLEEVHKQSEVKNEKRLNPADLIKHGYLVPTLVQLLCWITINVGNYTFLLNATQLSGNVIQNFTYTALSEFPAVVFMFVTLKLFSRRVNLALYMGLLGICCLILAFTPKDHTMIILWAFLSGKCFGGAAFMIIWLVTAELYPTNLRTQAVGLCSTVSRVFGLICPFISNLAIYWKPLPMILLGTPSLIAAILAFCLLPEAKDKSLPQNLFEARKFKFTPGDTIKEDEEETETKNVLISGK